MTGSRGTNAPGRSGSTGWTPCWKNSKTRRCEMVSTTSSKGTAVVSLPADDQILITREFNAPKHLVYRAWITPELVTQFWSGQRGTMRSVEIDLWACPVLADIRDQEPVGLREDVQHHG